MQLNDTDPTEEFIREAFENNFERLRFENGHALAPEVKERALEQVILYWRKLRDIAESVTDTEVNLQLPNQRTPKGRKFNIEGVVDIVREQGKTIMYDLKTHDAEFVKDNIDMYEEQLNVYAFIWRELRHQPLDEMAIIATQFPEPVVAAIRSNDEAEITRALSAWTAVVPVPFNREKVDTTIHSFGETVDAIEERRFAPPGLNALRLTDEKGQMFATRVCRNCDGRFSCDSYRSHATSSRRGDASMVRKYYADFGEETELEDRRDAGVPFD
jgi:hypothetical protein